MARSKRPNLTPRQQRFVEEYLVDLNATQAAIRAGYSEKTAKQQGGRMLTNADVAAAVAEGMDARSERTKTTADLVLREFRRIALSSMKNYMRLQESGEPVLDFSALDDDGWAAVQEMVVDEYTDGRGEDARPVKRVRFKLHNKVAALESLGKHLGIMDRPLRLELPELNGMQDLSEVMAFVLRAVAAGQITPGEGEQMARLIETCRRSHETGDLERRIEAIEAARSQPGARSPNLDGERQ